MEPTAEPILFLSNLRYHRTGPMNEQQAEIPISPFTDAPVPDLVSRAGVFGDEAEGRRDMSSILIGLACHFQPGRRGTQRSNPTDLLESLTDSLYGTLPVDLGHDGRNLGIPSM